MTLRRGDSDRRACTRPARNRELEERGGVSP